MEFKKEGEKFAFGFGTERTAGKGDLASATQVKEQTLLTSAAEVASVALLAGWGIYKGFKKSGAKKSKGKKTEKKSAKKSR